MSRTKQKPKLDPPAPLANNSAGEVMNLAEAAAYLRLPEEEVLRMVREQNLPARQVGQEWRLLKPAIQDWLRTGWAPPKSNKAEWLALAGAWKDDPQVEQELQEIYKRRGRPMTDE